MANDISNGDDEVHPLDRDYSEQPPKKAKRQLSRDGALVRIGAIGFGAGFLVLLGAAIVVSNAPPGGVFETIGSYLHQFGMVIILGAGLSVLIAHRAPKIREMVRHGRFKAPARGISFIGLLLVNLVVFVAVILFAYALTNAPSPYFVFLSITSLLSLSAAWMVIMIIWHDGILRAFGIGVLSGLVFNGVFGLIVANGPFFGVTGTVVLATHLGLIQLSGLLCAAYVGVLEQSRRNAELEKRETQRQFQEKFRGRLVKDTHAITKDSPTRTEG